METQAQERRGQPRVNLNGRVLAYLGDARIECHAIDISASGIAVRTQAAYPAGQYVRLNFALRGPSNAANWFDVDGVVARAASSEEGCILGVKFVLMDDAVVREIQGYVERSHQPPAPAHISGEYMIVSGRRR
jgi:hypothetical protein